VGAIESHSWDYTWSIAILSSREDAETLSATIKAAIAASCDKKTVIDVVINGNSDLGEKIGKRVSAMGQRGQKPVVLRVWDIGLADKAHAWNTFAHRIWPGSDIAYFIDGYAQVMPNALELLEAGLKSNAMALGATGVPTMGRSAETLRQNMVRNGGIHGNLYAVRGDVMMELRNSRFRLPLGLYRTDPLLGAAINFGLDPVGNAWDPRRILVVPEATWFVRVASAWRTKDLKSHWMKMVRQAWGRLENSAVREHMAVRRKPPQDLPETARDLVLAWINSHPSRAAWLNLRHPLCLLAVIKARRRRDWSQRNNPPGLIASITI
jgi:hypothetical protein